MQLRLTDRKSIAEETMAFWFEAEKTLRFKAGQFGEFSLTSPPHTDSKGNTRTFSLASSPRNDRIMIATRMRDSAFKKSLQAVPLGTNVELMGPMGNFTLHQDEKRPAVFLVGGIGITPVRSIVEGLTQDRLPRDIFVFYANRTRALSAFLDEFRDWSSVNRSLHFIPTLTDERPGNEDFEFGVIDEAMLLRHLSDLRAPVYYAVGPPGMVAAMRELLEKIGIDKSQIKTEDFAGY